MRYLPTSLELSSFNVTISTVYNAQPSKILSPRITLINLIDFSKWNQTALLPMQLNCNSVII